jgi:hypothetical protein
MNSCRMKGLRREAQDAGKSVYDLIDAKLWSDSAKIRVRTEYDAAKRAYYLDNHAELVAEARKACGVAVRTACINLETNLDASMYVGQNPIKEPATVNKTSLELRAELAAAEAAEQVQATAAARKAKLDGYAQAVHGDGRPDRPALPAVSRTTRAAPLAEFRSELKALASEFGARIVLVGDRTQAVLVQQ